MEDTRVVTHVDCMRGVAKVVVIYKGNKETITFNWVELSDGSGYGFQSDVFDGIVRMTDASSRLFLSNIVVRIAYAISDATVPLNVGGMNLSSSRWPRCSST
jgi:hypothetical protein